MADLSSIAAIKANLVQVTIGADTAPYEAKVSFTIKDERHPVQSARTGKDILAQLVVGRMVEVEIEFLQYDGTLLKRFAHADTTNNPAVGAQLTPEVVRIHDPQDVGAGNDLALLAVTWTEPAREIDGDKERRLKVKGIAQRDAATGKVYTIGV